MIEKRPYHVPVLVNEVLTYLSPKPGGVYVDATFGGGGHTRAILNAEPTCRVIAFDWDQEAITIHRERFEHEFGERILFVWGSFAQLNLLLRKHCSLTSAPTSLWKSSDGHGRPSFDTFTRGLVKTQDERRKMTGLRSGRAEEDDGCIDGVDGILADFGTSQYQIFSERGFSFAHDAPLDMRMSTSHHRITAAQVLNRSSEAELVRIFKEYGEEPHARMIARAIVAQRAHEPFKTTRQLAALIEKIIPRHGARIHQATRVFQALRIAVNHELDAIQHLLNQTVQVLHDGGRLVCISFHSLEDRLVKQFLQQHKKRPGLSGFELITDGVVHATDEECARNPASRSAKLRAGIWRDCM